MTVTYVLFVELERAREIEKLRKKMRGKSTENEVETGSSIGSKDSLSLISRPQDQKEKRRAIKRTLRIKEKQNHM